LKLALFHYRGKRSKAVITGFVGARAGRRTAGLEGEPGKKAGN